MKPISRKTFLAGAGALGAAALARPAIAKKRYVIKLGIDLAPDHPSTLHAQMAGKEIAAATDGAVTLQVFPSSQLGNDTHMLSGVRSGAIQMMAIGDNILATLVPSAAIDNIGFAFKDSQTAWTALDGKVGELVRADIETTGLHPMNRIWDEGFRQTTSKSKPINSPADLAGFKIRVPPSPISLSLFKDLGAAPTVINIAELYTALQTGVVDGQENPLSNIQTQKFYEVQKYCALTNHMWVGYWLVMNGDFWKSLPADYQKIVSAAFDKQTDGQRAASLALNNSLQEKLTGEGMVFNSPDLAPFRQKLISAGFYSEWKQKFDPALWAALEQTTGSLA
ncbi:MAG TPA: TRAP transporter substrate-binding protein [Acidocella sp.]|nr:TRAP transporter substrate-binding protein [Acidocella sp.]